MRTFFCGLLALLFSNSMYSQLADGTLSPNLTVTDIYGVQHDLYSYLDNGNPVILEFTATWCSPCWNYHQNGVLETLYSVYSIPVIMIECDGTTGINDIYGTSLNTQGDWRAGISYPIANDASYNDAFQIPYFPLIYAICPNKVLRRVEQNETVPQILATFNSTGCYQTFANNVGVYDILEPTMNCSGTLTDLGVLVGNSGSNAVTSFTVGINAGAGISTINWSGLLNPGEMVTVNFPQVNSVQGNIIASVIYSGDQNPNDDSRTESVVPLALQVSTNRLRMHLQTDAGPSQTTWAITNLNGDVVASGGPYAPAQNQAAQPITVDEEIVLNSTGCYQFHLYDAWGDGMYWGTTDGFCSLDAWTCFGNAIPIGSYDGITGVPYGELIFYFEVTGLVSTSTVSGCMDVQACNYNPTATCNANFLCAYSGDVCDDGVAQTFNDHWTADCACSGVLVIEGCTDAAACNYIELATVENGSCFYVGSPCNDGDAYTYADYVHADCHCEGFPISTSSCPSDYIDFGGSSTVPDPALGQNLVPGQVGVYYEDVVFVNTQAANGFPVEVLSITVNVNGTEVPLSLLGLSYTCSNGVDQSCIISSTGCINILGNPIQQGVFPMTINGQIQYFGTYFPISIDSFLLVFAGPEVVLGCTDETACNFNPAATNEDNSCLFLGAPCYDGSPISYYDQVNSDCDCVGTVQAQSGDCTELFISEYLEGTGNNKALELYNPTSSPINLATSGFAIARYANGGVIPTTINLSGVIEPHDVRVFVLDKRDPMGTGQEIPVATALQAVADTFVNPIYSGSNSAFYFNGDDAVGLLKNGVIVDLIGVIGELPANGGWADLYDPNYIPLTIDHSLVRDYFVGQGSLNLDGFNPTAQWHTYAANDFSHLGWHDAACSDIQINSLGAMLTANYSLCGGNSEMPTLQLESAPVGISNYTLQWYYRTGNQTCPEGSITGGWISIAGATSTTLTPDQFVGTRTFACYVNVAQGEVLDSGWMQNCALVSVASSTSQTIIGNPNVVPFNTYTYAVSTVVGNTYTWDVQNGAVISGQGTSVVQIMWGQNGPYQITLTESNGTCSNTSVLFVVNNSCSNTVSLASSMPQGFCEGAGAVLTANTSAAGVVFSWYKNGTLMANENGSSLMITEGGDYQVMITSGSCTSVSQILSVTQFTAPVVPDLSVSNQSPGCSGGSAEVWIEGLSFDSYLWSNGATSASIEVVASGDYSVVVTDQNGCSASSSVVTVNLSLTETLPICLVTVDQQTGNNQVIWEPLTSDVIDAYAVYKETNAADVYALIGTVAYGQDGIFTDVNSNSAVQASRYKLAIIDTCNVESSRSPLHKTIHLTSNVGLNNTVNLIWSAYEGFSFASYNIYRGTDINNMTLLTTIASNLTSYTDVSPIGGNAFYVIEVEGISCDPTRSAVSSRSNMIQHTASGVEEQASQMLRVYPNPATDQITIQCASSLIGQEYVIYNVVGEVVMRGIIGSSATTIDVGDLSSGTYAFKASNAKKLFVKK